ncbi:MAG: polyhydroxyalkanoate synthesis repressor PhaR [Bauldia sp.]
MTTDTALKPNPGKSALPNSTVVIRKYANRRLYDTNGSTYVTLDDLARMVRGGHDVVVQDAKTGEDISRPVLTQIVLEQEAKGPSLLSVDFLKDLIRLHDDEIQSAVPAYLDFSLATLKREQDRLSRRMPADLKSRPGALAAQVRRNIALFEQAVAVVEPCEDDAPPRVAGPVIDAEGQSELERIRSQLEAMQLQLDRLSERT